MQSLVRGILSHNNNKIKTISVTKNYLQKQQQKALLQYIFWIVISVCKLLFVLTGVTIVCKQRVPVG